MDFSNASIMQLMGAQMRYQSQRQVVLSQNIANIDSPGYQAQDLKPVKFEDLVQRQQHKLPLAATSKSHQSSTNVLAGPYRDEKTRKTYETTPQGNSVSLEEQMAKVSENNSQYQLTTNLLRKYTGMYRTAAVGAR
jgi:flagellar basal-body rod protein FlgB